MSSSTLRVKHCIIGGGIVGLALAARLAPTGSVALLERHPHFLMETSSHNSGVVHSGLYYPQDSLKTKLCVQGNRILRQLIAHGEQTGVVGAVCGKWIGASVEGEPEEGQILDTLLKNMHTLGIRCREVPVGEVDKEEPAIRMSRVIESSDTGIIDVHTLAAYFERLVERDSAESGGEREHLLVKNCSCAKMELTLDKQLTVVTSDGVLIAADNIVNSAGLSASTVHRFALNALGLSNSDAPTQEGFETYFCKGRYLRYAGPREKMIGGKAVPMVPKRLVYPCPLPGLKGLGVHSTVDLGGTLRFGPDAVYVHDPTDLDVTRCETEVRDAMYPAIAQCFPYVERGDLAVDFAGMRPKLAADGEGFRDFLIRKEEGLPCRTCLVTLGGIESPGLTASPALADYVAETVLGYSCTPGYWECQ